MKEKNKMYTTAGFLLLSICGIWVALLIPGFIGNAREIWFIQDTIDSSKINDDFINTEWKNAPEIIVDEELLEQMPTVENEVTQMQIEENIPTSKDEIPNEINLDVTFFPQAPDWNWELPWKEACEESSVVQAYYYAIGEPLDKETFKKEVLEIVEKQKELFGKYIDTSIEETAIFLEEYYGYTDYKIIDNPTIEEMKYELAQWHPIIAPFAWKELGNWFFTNWGPRYHMLVIVGYNEEFFLTNDVGTSRWENFAYTYETIMNSMHDLIPLWEWDILEWEQRILVLQ